MTQHSLSVWLSQYKRKVSLSSFTSYVDVDILVTAAIGRSSVRTSDIAKLYKQSDKRRRLKRRRPASQISPACGSRDKNQ